MAISEIEKLERRYAENPQGLTFAPLAEVHRKNGDVARALELLRPGLSLHPDYIPASIVLGRCHLDLGDLPAAEAAFTHVLALDEENVIALKALADITERLLRFDEAERWLHALLAVDRSNEEARDQLARIEVSRRQAEQASSASPDAVEAAGEETAAAGPTDALELVAEAGAETEPEPAAGSPPPPPFEPAFAWGSDSGANAAEEEVVPLAFEELAPPENAAPPEGIELEQPVLLEEPVAPISGLVGRSEPVEELEHLELDAEFQVETSDDIVLRSAGANEFQVANAAEELLESRRAQEPPAPPPSEPVVAVAPEPAPAAEPAPAPEPVAATEPEPVVTESMAEVLRVQGHAAEALRVYRELESRGAGDARMRDRIAELERTPADSAPAASAPPEPAEAYAASATGGESVARFLQRLLAGRPPAAAASPPVHAQAAPAGTATGAEGAPTRPAHDSLSLSSVFGDEPSHAPPAVPAAPAPSGSGEGGVSYDEFFGAAGTASAPRQPRASDSKSDDLDQFHAWLQNLKR